MKLEIFSFEDKTPKRGKIICFSEVNRHAAFYLLDGRSDAWGICIDELEYACPASDLQNYGHYSHWARVDKTFNIDWDIPEE